MLYSLPSSCVKRYIKYITLGKLLALTSERAPTKLYDLEFEDLTKLKKESGKFKVSYLMGNVFSVYHDLRCAFKFSEVTTKKWYGKIKKN